MPSGQAERWTAVGSTGPDLLRMTSTYLIVDTIVVAATFLDGHTGLAIIEEAGVTLAALRTVVRALWGGTECRAAQGAGVCAELIVAVGGALHCCKEWVWFRAPGKEGLQGPRSSLSVLSLPLCPLVSAFPAPYSRQKDSFLQGLTWPPSAWQALT